MPVKATSTTDLLVCAATLMELRAFEPALGEESLADGVARRGDAVFLLTGVGIPQALATTVQAAMREWPQRILNIGIAGAYPNSGLSIGDVVLGESEVYGDIGMELPQEPGFWPLSESAWGEMYSRPLPLTLDPQWVGARVARGCTVNTCTGTDETGRRREETFQAAFETMEGAAVAQAGQSLGVPVCEVRAISNIAAHRDMRPENIRLALERLQTYLHERQ